ncbi:hypothetical protein [Glycomyces artemisiae]|uniref:Uncharacterized protein n=1 Tax=Glycomyces artemisiae TaxID=1076443 RepID=A0A2T0UCW9_9ACTN|nr:hypothetical protein [Glycomyces artemisiae]PRY55769.1 hypothetical protein B0I28_11282 [Glycomyces artemisiae]
MTAFTVRRTATAILVGDRPPHPERTMLVEARGALLYWDALDLRAHPAAEVFDARAAGDWLWEVYGPEALTGAGTMATEWESPVLDAARNLAFLHWAGVWWPASHAAGIPALPAGLLRAETAWYTAGLEHLLDDDTAVERALAEVDLGTLVSYPEAADLAAGIADLADSYGVALRDTARLRPEDWALAAGGAEEGLAVASGSAPIDWSLVPARTLDAAGEAAWRFEHRSGAWVLHVAAPAAPDAAPAALTAVVDTVEIPLRLDSGTGTFTGEAPAPPDFAMRLGGGRPIQVQAPGYAADRSEDRAERRAALIAFARDRLASPDATLTERAAA